MSGDGPRQRRSRLRDPVVLALAIVALLSLGTAAADRLITGRDIADKSITGRDIKRKSVPLSVLRGGVAGTPGRPGDDGAPGEPGAPGLVGETGPKGSSAITEILPLATAIPAVAPSTELKFLGNPVEGLFVVGDQGVVSSTVTIGSDAGTIDDEAKFSLSICFAEPDTPTDLTAIEQESPGDPFGVSPVLAKDVRVAVNLTTGFAVVGGEPGESFFALLGPCVLNETAIALDDNGRAMGYVLISAL